MDNNINEHAFPFVSNGGIHEHQIVQVGLSKREYFAIKILSGFAADSSMEGGSDTCSKLAVSWADALIKELNK